ncbi:MAG: ASCH domain-containing protein [Bacillota bacterium]
MKALLSIKPEFVEKIISGEKKYEYRKRIFKQKIKSVVIYCTMPVGKIIGEFTIDKIINDTPLNIWLETKNESGIGFDYFNDYFKNKDQGYAMKIDKLNLYEKAVSRDSLSNFTAPQSFKYVEDDFMQENLKSK